MSRGVDELARSGPQVLGVVDDLDNLVQGHSGDERAVGDRGTVGEVSDLLVALDADDVLVEGEALLGQSLGDGLPDSSSSVTSGEAESSVGSPVAIWRIRGVSSRLLESPKLTSFRQSSC